MRNLLHLPSGSVPFSSGGSAGAFGRGGPSAIGATFVVSGVGLAM